MTIELKDTVEMMNSKDCKDRFCAEYLQTKIRYEKLLALLRKWDAQDSLYTEEDEKNGTIPDFLGFKPTCPKFLLERQLSQMGFLIKTYEIRAVIEGIDLHKCECELTEKVLNEHVHDVIIKDVENNANGLNEEMKKCRFVRRPCQTLEE